MIPAVNALMDGFSTVVLTQDWHPAGHSSFAASHPGRHPFESVVEMPYGDADAVAHHCVQGSAGRGVSPRACAPTPAQMILRKGFRPGIDSYSAFFRE
jgi:nicotinamidase/pyrazinamidase